MEKTPESGGKPDEVEILTDENAELRDELEAQAEIIKRYREIIQDLRAGAERDWLVIDTLRKAVEQSTKLSVSMESLIAKSGHGVTPNSSVAPFVPSSQKIEQTFCFNNDDPATVAERVQEYLRNSNGTYKHKNYLGKV